MKLLTLFSRCRMGSTDRMYWGHVEVLNLVLRGRWCSGSEKVENRFGPITRTSGSAAATATPVKNQSVTTSPHCRGHLVLAEVGLRGHRVVGRHVCLSLDLQWHWSMTLPVRVDMIFALERELRPGELMNRREFVTSLYGIFFARRGCSRPLTTIQPGWLWRISSLWPLASVRIKVESWWFDWWEIWVLRNNTRQKIFPLLLVNL